MRSAIRCVGSQSALNVERTALCQRLSYSSFGLRSNCRSLALALLQFGRWRNRARGAGLEVFRIRMATARAHRHLPAKLILAFGLPQ